MCFVLLSAWGTSMGHKRRWQRWGSETTLRSLPCKVGCSAPRQDTARRFVTLECLCVCVCVCVCMWMLAGQCDELMQGRLTDAVTFARVLAPDVDAAKIPLSFHTEFCSTLCQQIRNYGVIGGPNAPLITKCVAAHDTLMLHLVVDQDLLEIQVQSRPVATEDNRYIVPDPKRWAMADSDEIPGMQVTPTPTAL